MDGAVHWPKGLGSVQVHAAFLSFLFAGGYSNNSNPEPQMALVCQQQLFSEFKINIKMLLEGVFRIFSLWVCRSSSSLGRCAAGATLKGGRSPFLLLFGLNRTFYSNGEGLPRESRVLTF